MLKNANAMIHKYRYATSDLTIGPKGAWKCNFSFLKGIMTIRPIVPPTDMVGNKEAKLPTSRSLEVNSFSLKKNTHKALCIPMILN